MIPRSFLPLRIARARPRLFASGGVGILVAVTLAFSTPWRRVTGVLVGWDTGIAIYLGLAVYMMGRSEIGDIRRRAADQDEGQLTILGLTVASALVSLAAIVVQLGTSRTNGGRQPGSLLLAMVTIALSWAFIHTMFALHYAHEFYDESSGRGLAFPGGEEDPDYWDFLYFALVVGMTSQVSDVGVISKEIRRTVAVHGLVSFVFNVALLALMVNIAASAI